MSRSLSVDQMKVYYDDQVTQYIKSNLVFHEWTKHIKFNCHFVLSKEISIEFDSSNDQLVDILTLLACRSQFICNKFGAHDLLLYLEGKCWNVSPIYGEYHLLYLGDVYLHI